jgi:hypothetical protein
MFQKLWQRVKGLIPSIQSTPAVPEVNFESLSVVGKCAFVYNALDVEQFQNYRHSDGVGKMVSVVHVNIEACMEDIAQQIQFIEETGFIPVGREYAATSKFINRFLVTKRNYYLDSIYNAVKDLRTVVLDLCAVVDKTKDSDYHSYNLRMLNALLFSLTELGSQLNDIANDIAYRS